MYIQILPWSNARSLGSSAFYCPHSVSKSLVQLRQESGLPGPTSKKLASNRDDRFMFLPLIRFSLETTFSANPEGFMSGQQEQQPVEPLAQKRQNKAASIGPIFKEHLEGQFSGQWIFWNAQGQVENFFYGIRDLKMLSDTEYRLQTTCYYDDTWFSEYGNVADVAGSAVRPLLPNISFPDTQWRAVEFSSWPVTEPDPDVFLFSTGHGVWTTMQWKEGQRSVVETVLCQGDVRMQTAVQFDVAGNDVEVCGVACVREHRGAWPSAEWTDFELAAPQVHEHATDWVQSAASRANGAHTLDAQHQARHDGGWRLPMPRGARVLNLPNDIAIVIHGNQFPLVVTTLWRRAPDDVCIVSTRCSANKTFEGVWLAVVDPS